MTWVLHEDCMLPMPIAGHYTIINIIVCHIWWMFHYKIEKVLYITFYFYLLDTLAKNYLDNKNFFKNVEEIQ